MATEIHSYYEYNKYKFECDDKQFLDTKDDLKLENINVTCHVNRVNQKNDYIVGY